MPSQEQRLFLSMVSDEFRSYRELLTKDLERGQVDVATQEKWGTLGLTTLEKLDHHLARCSAVIHVVGDGVGHVPPAAAVDALLERHPDFLPRLAESAGMTRELLGECSYTQLEAYLAIYHQARLHIYRPHAKAPREAGFTADDTQRESQRRHFERIRALGRDRDVFLNQERLSSYVLADLRDILPALEPVQRLSPPRFLHHSAEFFLGREKELEMLDQAWADGTNVLSLIAWGGVGKTALVSEWVQTRFIDKEWRDADGQPCPLAYFDWSFYDQGTRGLDSDTAARTGSVGSFFEEALMFFGDANPNRPGKGERLAEFVRRQRTLLILDGLEPLQQPPGHPEAGRLNDPDLRKLLAGLAQKNLGLCLVTSREGLKDLEGVRGSGAKKRDLEELPKPVAVRLLHELGVTGNQQELENACEVVHCHPLSLTLLGRFLVDAHGGDIRRIDRIKDLQRADELTRKDRHRTAWRVLEAYDTWLANGNPKTLAVLRTTGLFDRPASAGCMRALRAAPVIKGLTDDLYLLEDEEWNVLLRGLERAHLIRLRHEDSRTDEEPAIDAHPLVRQYFALRVRGKNPISFRKAHSRLFEYLCESTEYQPSTLVGLQPLYQAVAHGCLSGRYREAREIVYRDRIMRGTGGNGFFSERQFGAFGSDLEAISCFFESPWRKVYPTLNLHSQAWLLNGASFLLRSLGRLKEAINPGKLAVDRFLEIRDWRSASGSAGNLTELGVLLGQLKEAARDASRAIGLADRSKEFFEALTARTSLADVLHQSGQQKEASQKFIESEAMQKKWQPGWPFLYSLRGFQYLDLILGPVERAAWQKIICNGSDAIRTQLLVGLEPILEEARERSWTTLEMSRKHALGLLEVAFFQIALATSSFYRTLILPHVTPPDAPTITVNEALSAIRKANSLDILPKALLTAAFHEGTLGGRPDKAEEYLTEAQEIAERGPMPLYLADVHLHRARLFRDRGELVKARELIERCGYWRRKEELEDAEEAAVNW